MPFVLIVTRDVTTHGPTLSDSERRPVAMAEVAALTLVNIPLDVQIGICLFLHPSDILALRKVCQHQKLLLLKSVKYY